jgi:REP element-mobilizing transposase RayT
VVFDKDVDKEIREVCIEIEKRYQVKFLEIGIDKDHVHFLVQSVPTYSVTKIVTIIKSITAREVFKKCLHVKKQLWGGEFWTDGYFVNTVSKFGDESTISKYVREQGVEKDYIILHKAKQLDLFSDTP